jgi:hypothetical protein
MMGNIVTTLLELLRPGMVVGEVWNQFCDSMLMGAFVSALVGIGVFEIMRLPQRVSRWRRVGRIGWPLIFGVCAAEVCLVLFAVWQILTDVPAEDRSGFLSFGTFLLVILYGAVAFLVYEVLLAALVHTRAHARYGTVPFPARLLRKRPS